MFSNFAQGVRVETAFHVLAVARRLQSQGKRVIELEIGDSPFPTTPAAQHAGIAAIQADQAHYCPSVGIPEFRAAAAEYVRREHGIPAGPENVVAGHGAKIFELLFCEAFLNPGDGVLIFSPHFPTYVPNIERRAGRVVYSTLEQSHAFRPNLADVDSFLQRDPAPRAIFLNSPHNPTGGVTPLEDLQALAERIQGKEVYVFSDEPYDQMVWQGKHASLLALPGMFENCVAAYTFSKSYSMSGWRLGFAIAAPRVIDIFATLLNTTLSCVPPFVQLAGAAALKSDASQRDANMLNFKGKVQRLATGLDALDGFRCPIPHGTFYAFPNVKPVCNRLGITSQGLAMYLLEGADDKLGVACLGGESFGQAGAGFLRFSCAQEDHLLQEAIEFIGHAVTNESRVSRYLAEHPTYRLAAQFSITSP